MVKDDSTEFSIFQVVDALKIVVEDLYLDDWLPLVN
jgi:hypothetical protein